MKLSLEKWTQRAPGVWECTAQGLPYGFVARFDRIVVLEDEGGNTLNLVRVPDISIPRGLNGTRIRKVCEYLVHKEATHEHRRRLQEQAKEGASPLAPESLQAARG